MILEKKLKHYLDIEEAMFNSQGESTIPKDIHSKIKWSEAIKEHHRAEDNSKKLESSSDKVSKKTSQETESSSSSLEQSKKNWECLLCKVELDASLNNCTTMHCPYTKTMYLETMTNQSKSSRRRTRRRTAKKPKPPSPIVAQSSPSTETGHKPSTPTVTQTPLNPPISPSSLSNSTLAKVEQGKITAQEDELEK